MCFRFDACFGAADNDDCHGGSSANKGVPSHGGHHAAKTTSTAPPHYARPAPAPQQQQRNGGHYHHYGHYQGVAGNGYRAPHHHQLPAADEEGRKASNVNDGMRRAHAPATTNGDHHGYAAGAAYVYSGARNMMVMLGARNARVVAGDDGCHGAHDHFHDHEPAAADHQYSTTASTTTCIADHGRYY